MYDLNDNRVLEQLATILKEELVEKPMLMNRPFLVMDILCNKNIPYRSRIASVLLRLGIAKDRSAHRPLRIKHIKMQIIPDEWVTKRIIEECRKPYIKKPKNLSKTDAQAKFENTAMYAGSRSTLVGVYVPSLDYWEPIEKAWLSQAKFTK